MNYGVPIYEDYEPESTITNAGVRIELHHVPYKEVHQFVKDLIEEVKFDTYDYKVHDDLEADDGEEVWDENDELANPKCSGVVIAEFNIEKREAVDKVTEIVTWAMSRNYTVDDYWTC